jgi:hypothetical protein
LQDLIDAIGVVLATSYGSFKFYPMMAGTDVAAASIDSCSITETIRMPLKLLIQADIEAVITSVENGEVLLQQAPVRRHLFYLGGVPKWIVLYVS